MSSSNDVFGIDLGTTNSCISVYTDSGPTMVPVDGFELVPSVLAHDGSNWLVGRAARNYSRMYPGQAITSIKRKMKDAGYRCSIAGKSLSPTDVSAMILDYLAQKAAEYLGRFVSQAVITVPAWFGDAERRATFEAGKQAGLDVLRIVNEPTAAALVYADPQVLSKVQTWVVYDLGGGTFDVSVLRVASPMVEVLASCGNTFLGGDDFDEELVHYFVHWFRDRYQKDIDNDPVARAKLRHLAEEAKIALSTEPSFRVLDSVKVGEESFDLDIEISRQKFEQLIEHYLDSSIQKVQNALEDAKVKASEVDRLLLVGGSTRIPLVVQKLENYFGRLPEGQVDPDLAVALGAALQAGISSGQDYRRYVIDICPHSLGVAAFGEEDARSLTANFFDPDSFADILSGMGKKGKDPLTFVPLIKRNSKLPAKFTEQFSKMSPEQDHAKISVYQGESKLTTENTFIGSFLAPLSQDEDTEILVGFEYDLNGMIQISVTDPGAKQIFRRYSMSLTASADENSESELLLDDQDFDDLQESEAAARVSDSATNYLIQQVEKELIDLPEEAGAPVLEKLANYRRLLLNEEETAELDDLEEDLYSWLEGIKERNENAEL